MRRFRELSSWWAFSGGRSGCGSSAFSLIRLCQHCFLFSSSFVSFGLWCAVCPSGDLHLVSVGCYINIAGRKPISRRKILWIARFASLFARVMSKFSFDRAPLGPYHRHTPILTHPPKPRCSFSSEWSPGGAKRLPYKKKFHFFRRKSEPSERER
jgi:hypothetical protein